MSSASEADSGLHDGPSSTREDGTLAAEQFRTEAQTLQMKDSKKQYPQDGQILIGWI